MKIEIDLNEILGDENGEETIQDSVKRQVIEKLSYDIQKGISKKIDEEIQKVIHTSIKEGISKQMPSIINDLMNVEYFPINRWGDKEKTATTVRGEIIKVLTSQCVYEKKNYDSDKNYFTKAIDEIASVNVNEFKYQFNKTIDAIFTKECLQYAVNVLKEKIGVE